MKFCKNPTTIEASLYDNNRKKKEKEISKFDRHLKREDSSPGLTITFRSQGTGVWGGTRFFGKWG